MVVIFSARSARDIYGPAQLPALLCVVCACPVSLSRSGVGRDATKTQGVESSVPLGDSDAGLKLLRVYVRTAKGKRVAKYMPFE